MAFAEVRVILQNLVGESLMKFLLPTTVSVNQKHPVPQCLQDLF